MNTCPVCGTIPGGEEKFCSACGTPINGSHSDITVTAGSGDSPSSKRWSYIQRYFYPFRLDGSIPGGPAPERIRYMRTLMIFVVLVLLPWLIWIPGLYFRRIPLVVQAPFLYGVLPYVALMATLIYGRLKGQNDSHNTILISVFLALGVIAVMVVAFLSACEGCVQSVSGCPG